MRLASMHRNPETAHKLRHSHLRSRDPKLTDYVWDGSQIIELRERNLI